MDLKLFHIDLQGCTYVVQSFTEYVVNRGKVILLLVEAIGACLHCFLYLYFFFFQWKSLLNPSLS